MASPVAKEWTQTLATGFSNKGFRGHRIGGFTLIELLLVVVILAVMLASGLSLMRFGVNERRVEQEGQRLQSLLDFLCEQSLLQNRPHGLAFASGAYAAMRAPSQAAFVLSGAAPATSRSSDNTPWLPVASTGAEQSEWALPEPLQLRIKVNGRPVKLNQELPVTPQLVCDNSGQLPPFEMRLQHPELKADYLVRHQWPAAVTQTLAALPDAENHRDVSQTGWVLGWQESE